jgi:hypothetical protein
MTAAQVPDNKCYLATYIDRETVDKIDKLRGEVSRNRIVRKAINQYLEANAKALGERQNQK